MDAGASTHGHGPIVDDLARAFAVVDYCNNAIEALVQLDAMLPEEQIRIPLAVIREIHERWQSRVREYADAPMCTLADTHAPVCAPANTPAPGRALVNTADHWINTGVPAAIMDAPPLVPDYADELAPVLADAPVLAAVPTAVRDTDGDLLTIFTRAYSGSMLSRQSFSCRFSRSVADPPVTFTQRWRNYELVVAFMYSSGVGTDTNGVPLSIPSAISLTYREFDADRVVAHARSCDPVRFYGDEAVETVTIGPFVLAWLCRSTRVPSIHVMSLTAREHTWSW